MRRGFWRKKILLSRMQVLRSVLACSNCFRMGAFRRNGLRRSIERATFWMAGRSGITKTVPSNIERLGKTAERRVSKHIGAKAVINSGNGIANRMERLPGRNGGLLER